MYIYVTLQVVCIDERVAKGFFFISRGETGEI